MFAFLLRQTTGVDLQSVHRGRVVVNHYALIDGQTLVQFLRIGFAQRTRLEMFDLLENGLLQLFQRPFLKSQGHSSVE